MRPSLRRVGLGLLVGGAFFAGLSVDHAARAARDDERYRALDVFAQVLAHVENVYVDDVQERDLVYGAIDGMLAKLDPHSAFLRPEQYRAMREDTAGEFEGVGVDLASKDGHLTVVAPVPDSPAERAGLRTGDRIVEIDGAPTRDLSIAEAGRRLRGPLGTAVRLLVSRGGFATPQPLVVVRDRIRTVSIEWRIADRERGLVYVKLKAFQERTDRAVKRALDEARAALGGEIRGLVLDLRGNAGGLLDQAVRVSDRFLRDGVIVSTETRNRRGIEVERAHEKDTEPGYPMAVLVDRGSASASEIVAGALQDHGRAAIVGTRTFGKGSVQQIMDLADGSGLKLTVARYFTPNHRSIQDRGIEPDVAVGDGAEGASALGGDPVAATSGGAEPRRDPALDVALAQVATRAGRAVPVAPGTGSPP